MASCSPRARPNLVQPQILRIVTGQPQAVAGRQPGHGAPHGAPHQGDEARTLRRRFGGLRSRLHRRLVGQRVEAPARPQAIDVPLRQDCSQPRAQAAAAVKVAKQRLARAAAVRKPIQLAVERVGQLLRRAGGVDCIGGAEQCGPVAGDEVFPGRLEAFDARGRQRQVFEVQSAQVCLDRGGVGHAGVRQAALEGGLPQRQTEPPAVGTRIAMQPGHLMCRQHKRRRWRVRGQVW